MKYIIVYPMNTDGQEHTHGQVFDTLDDAKRNIEFLDFDDLKLYEAIEIGQ